MTELITNPRASFARIDTGMERLLGHDARLMYGFGVPVVIMGVLIALMMIVNTSWAVAVAMIIEVVMLAAVVAGFMNVLDDEREAS